jgi:AraC-like DNA-binding protein
VSHVAQVRASVLIPFVALLRERDVRVDELLADVGLPATVLADPERPLPYPLVCQLIHAASRRTGLPDFGLLVGASTPFESLGAFGTLVTGSRNLHDALFGAVRLFPWFRTGARVWLEIEPDRIWLRHVDSRRAGVGEIEAEQFTVMMMLQLVRLAGASATRIDLRASWRAGLDRCEALSGARITVGRPTTGVAIPRRFLHRALDAPRVAPRSLAQLERRLRATAPASDFVDSVRQAIGALLEGRYPDIRRSARALGMSVRTFQRRLAQSGVSYSALIDRERHDRALRLLHDRAVKVTEVAIELGYTDLANFTHAFRRWTGVSPREFRRLELGT